jgi:hypothetical protein
MKTMTEVQAEIYLKERHKVTIDTLRQMQKLLHQLSDCITILIHPIYTYNAEERKEGE